MRMFHKMIVFAAVNPFNKANTFLGSTFTSILNLVITVFGIGIVICGAMIWKGDEENVQRFKKAIVWIFIGFVISILGKGILAWVKAGVS